MILRWTPQAAKDRRDIWDHVAAEDPAAAAKLDLLFARSSERLDRFPELGRPGRIAGTRELLPPRRYRLVYEIEDETIWILALVHTSRQWPPAV